MPDLPEIGKRLDISEDSGNRLAATWPQLTDHEREDVRATVSALERGDWDVLTWIEDIEPGVVQVLLGEELVFVWRLYPGTDDVAQVLYVGHPNLYR